MIAIVDYGVGNLFSLSSSVKSLGAEVCVTRDADDLRAADHILLPGVGAFADAMAKLEATGLVDQRTEHRHCGHCRTIRVRDNALRALRRILGIDFGDDEGNLRVFTPS